MAPRETSLTDVSVHLREATDRVSELLAALDAERETVSRESLIESVRAQATDILREVWSARWALPIEVKP